MEVCAAGPPAAPRPPRPPPAAPAVLQRPPAAAGGTIACAPLLAAWNAGKGSCGPGNLSEKCCPGSFSETETNRLLSYADCTRSI